MDKKVNIDLLSDQPINLKDQDDFNRGDFVDAIAQIIYSQSSKVNPTQNKDFKNVDENMIIGLYGSWGHGKSSILNLLKENLENMGLQTVYFNPWMYGSEEQLIISLFNSIISKCGLKGIKLDKLIKLFDQYYPLVSLVAPRTAEVGKAIAKSFKSSSEPINAYACKNEIDKILLGTANPLTIFIDDVDRLSKSEIHVLFKTLRLVASFKHVIYVIACDFDMVSKSIKENYADGSVEDGRAFLEKIIQIPIRIPEIKPELLYNYALNYIKITCDIDLTKKPLIKEIFEEFFNTPRDVKRFVNSFRFTQKYFNNAIDEIDLIFIELIRVKMQELFELMKVYYKCVSKGNPDSNYNAVIFDDLLKQKPEYFRSDGTFGNKHICQKYNKIFSELFNTQIRALSFDHSGIRLGYKDYMKFKDVLQLKTFHNPNMLVYYFEKSEQIN